MRRLLLGALVLASCARPTAAPPESLAPLPIVTAPPIQPPAPIATASEPAVRLSTSVVEPETTTTHGPGDDWGFPYPIMHRDFEPHGDCRAWDDLLWKYGLDYNGSLDRAHATMVRESGCIPGVWNWHATGPGFNDESYSLWQLNTYGSLGPALQEMCGLADPVQIDGRRVYLDLFDVETNIQCAGILKARFGWSPWGY